MRSVDGGAVPVVLIQYPSASIAKLCHCGYPPAKSGANAQSQDGQQGPVEDDLQPPRQMATGNAGSGGPCRWFLLAITFCVSPTVPRWRYRGGAWKEQTIYYKKKPANPP